MNDETIPPSNPVPTNLRKWHTEEFPTDALPTVIREWVVLHDQYERSGHAAPALAALTLFGAAMQTRFTIHPGMYDSTVPCLAMFLDCSPNFGKTPIFEAVTQGFVRYEKECSAAFDSEWRHHREQINQVRDQLKSMSKEPDPDPNARQKLIERLSYLENAMGPFQPKAGYASQGTLEAIHRRSLSVTGVVVAVDEAPSFLYKTGMGRDPQQFNTVFNRGLAGAWDTVERLGDNLISESEGIHGYAHASVYLAGHSDNVGKLYRDLADADIGATDRLIYVRIDINEFGIMPGGRPTHDYSQVLNQMADVQLLILKDHDISNNTPHKLVMSNEDAYRVHEWAESVSLSRGKKKVVEQTYKVAAILCETEAKTATMIYGAGGLDYQITSDHVTRAIRIMEWVNENDRKQGIMIRRDDDTDLLITLFERYILNGNNITATKCRRQLRIFPAGQFSTDQVADRLRDLVALGWLDEVTGGNGKPSFEATSLGVEIYNLHTDSHVKVG